MPIFSSPQNEQSSHENSESINESPQSIFEEKLASCSLQEFTQALPTLTLFNPVLALKESIKRKHNGFFQTLLDKNLNLRLELIPYHQDFLKTAFHFIEGQILSGLIKDPKALKILDNLLWQLDKVNQIYANEKNDFQTDYGVFLEKVDKEKYPEVPLDRRFLVSDISDIDPEDFQKFTKGSFTALFSAREENRKNLLAETGDWMNKRLKHFNNLENSPVIHKLYQLCLEEVESKLAFDRQRFFEQNQAEIKELSLKETILFYSLFYEKLFQPIQVKMPETHEHKVSLEEGTLNFLEELTTGAETILQDHRWRQNTIQKIAEVFNRKRNKTKKRRGNKNKKAAENSPKTEKDVLSFSERGYLNRIRSTLIKDFKQKILNSSPQITAIEIGAFGEDKIPTLPQIKTDETKEYNNIKTEIGDLLHKLNNELSSWKKDFSTNYSRRDESDSPDYEFLSTEKPLAHLLVVNQIYNSFSHEGEFENHFPELNRIIFRDKFNFTENEDLLTDSDLEENFSTLDSFWHDIYIFLDRKEEIISNVTLKHNTNKVIDYCLDNFEKIASQLQEKYLKSSPSPQHTDEKVAYFFESFFIFLLLNRPSKAVNWLSKLKYTIYDKRLDNLMKKYSDNWIIESLKFKTFIEPEALNGVRSLLIHSFRERAVEFVKRPTITYKRDFSIYVLFYHILENTEELTNSEIDIILKSTLPSEKRQNIPPALQQKLFELLGFSVEMGEKLINHFADHFNNYQDTFIKNAQAQDAVFFKLLEDLSPIELQALQDFIQNSLFSNGSISQGDTRFFETNEKLFAWKIREIAGFYPSPTKREPGRKEHLINFFFNLKFNKLHAHVLSSLNEHKQNHKKIVERKESTNKLPLLYLHLLNFGVDFNNWPDDKKKFYIDSVKKLRDWDSIYNKGTQTAESKREQLLPEHIKNINKFLSAYPSLRKSEKQNSEETESWLCAYMIDQGYINPQPNKPLVEKIKSFSEKIKNIFEGKEKKSTSIEPSFSSRLIDRESSKINGGQFETANKKESCIEFSPSENVEGFFINSFLAAFNPEKNCFESSLLIDKYLTQPQSQLHFSEAKIPNLNFKIPTEIRIPLHENSVILKAYQGDENGKEQEIPLNFSRRFPKVTVDSSSRYLKYKIGISKKRKQASATISFHQLKNLYQGLEDISEKEKIGLKAKIFTLNTEFKFKLEEFKKLSPHEALSACTNYVKSNFSYFEDLEKIKENSPQSIEGRINYYSEIAKKRGKQYGGVCTEAQIVLCQMFRELGFYSGITEGIVVEKGGKNSNEDYHAQTWVLFPNQDGEMDIIFFDGTPSTHRLTGVLESQTSLTENANPENSSKNENKQSENADKNFNAEKSPLNQDQESKLESAIKTDDVFEIDENVKKIYKQQLELVNGNVDLAIEWGILKISKKNISAIYEFLEKFYYAGFYSKERDLSDFLNLKNDLNSNTLENDISFSKLQKRYEATKAKLTIDCPGKNEKEKIMYVYSLYKKQNISSEEKLLFTILEKEI